MTGTFMIKWPDEDRDTGGTSYENGSRVWRNAATSQRTVGATTS